MDLIYMDTYKKDLGIMKDFVFDLAFGADENDFECKIYQSNHCCKGNYFLYIEGTEYGGIIDSIGVDTDAEEVIYSGRTWHGILNSKVLMPTFGSDYLILDGDANSVLATLILEMGISNLFKASSDVSGITISNYKMDRYIKGYDGIRKMLKSAGAKLNISFSEGFVVLSAKPLVDYSEDEQFDTDQISFKIKRIINRTNNMVCLGKGELSQREVVSLYMDYNGNIRENTLYFGVAGICDVLDYPNAESTEELIKSGKEKLKEAWASDEVEFNFTSDDKNFDIGDIVGAVEPITGVEVAEAITKKIVNITDTETKISYKVGG